MRATLLDLLAVFVVSVVVGAICLLSLAVGERKVAPYRPPSTQHQQQGSNQK